jgi:3'-5' exoribonuclease
MEPYLYTDPIDLRTLEREAKSLGRLQAKAWVRVERITPKKTKRGDNYYEVSFADADGGKLALKAWADSAAIKRMAELAEGSYVEVSAVFADEGSYGIGAADWAWRALLEEEIEVVMLPNEETRARQKADYDFIKTTMAGLRDPRLAGLGMLFLNDLGERFRRTAAARNYHHARRGGLVEHTAQMMRTADVVSGVYPHLNRDLLLAGVLFHDCGKLWESTYSDRGFTPVYDQLGELLGHISIGIELVNKLWKTLLEKPEAADWGKLEPSSEEVRRHLLHLIASHHGTREFGSPVEPKTPEAVALHYVDNLDAKLEMLRGAYEGGVTVAPGIYDRVRPLTSNLVQPLPVFVEPEAEFGTAVLRESE